MPAAVREAWRAATGGVITDVEPPDRKVGRTEAAQAYRLLHTGMAQAGATLPKLMERAAPLCDCGVTTDRVARWNSPARKAIDCSKWLPAGV